MATRAWQISTKCLTMPKWLQLHRLLRQLWRASHRHLTPRDLVQNQRKERKVALIMRRRQIRQGRQHDTTCMLLVLSRFLRQDASRFRGRGDKPTIYTNTARSREEEESVSAMIHWYYDALVWIGRSKAGGRRSSMPACTVTLAKPKPTVPAVFLVFKLQGTGLSCSRGVHALHAWSHLHLL